jgi:hypothetical protein
LLQVCNSLKKSNRKKMSLCDAGQRRGSLCGVWILTGLFKKAKHIRILRACTCLLALLNLELSKLHFRKVWCSPWTNYLWSSSHLHFPI